MQEQHTSYWLCVLTVRIDASEEILLQAHGIESGCHLHLFRSLKLELAVFDVRHGDPSSSLSVDMTVESSVICMQTFAAVE